MSIILGPAFRRGKVHRQTLPIQVPTPFASAGVGVGGAFVAVGLTEGNLLPTSNSILAARAFKSMPSPLVEINGMAFDSTMLRRRFGWHAGLALAPRTVDSETPVIRRSGSLSLDN